MHQLKICFKRNWKLLFIPLLLATTLATIFGVSHSQIAKAATFSPKGTTAECSSLGTLREPIYIFAGSVRIGELDIYYNSSTGFNCAKTVVSGEADNGKAKTMSVAIESCTQRTAGSTCTHYQGAGDSGKYIHYAGPVGVKAPGRCISVAGEISWAGEPIWVHTNGATHCG